MISLFTDSLYPKMYRFQLLYGTLAHLPTTPQSSDSGVT